MKKIVLSILSLCAMATANAQTDIFLKGDYVEVGTFVDGAFGSALNAPAGFHPITDCPTAGPGKQTLGFVSDPDKDGWLVSGIGKSAYMGDYFVPGTPFEGFEVEVNGVKGRNWAAGMGVNELTTTATSFSSSVSEQRGVWEGNFGNLSMTQTTVLKKSKLYFVIYVDFVNTGTTTLNNVYYHRGLDPDNEEPWSCQYYTINEIVYQPSLANKNCLVSAIGNTYGSFAYLGLGTKDCRAKCMNIPGWHPGSLAGLYNQSGTSAGYNYNVGWKTASTTSDEAIGVVWNLGNLAPGQKTSLAFTYILKKADLDSALGETAPKFSSDGFPFASFSTIRVCPGNKVPMNIINGGQYKWIWTPATDMAAVGSSVKIAPGGTIPAITGTKVYPDGAVSGDSVEVTVWGKKTYIATGISNCDTQTLTFYVDTISFSTPPSVTSPVRYCEGETATALTAGAASGATLNWYSSPSGGTGSASAPVPSTTFPASVTDDFYTTSYWVSQTNAAGCETPRAQIDVIITRKPPLPKTIDLLYCFGAETQPLTAEGTLLKWYDAATLGTRYPLTPVPSSNAAGITDYFVSQTINGCESDRSKLSVEISQVIARFTMSDDSLCGPEILTLNNTSTTSSTGDFTSSWSFGDGSSSGEKDATHAYADARNDYEIILLVENEQKCTDTATRTVHVFPKPEVTITASDKQICQGNAIDYAATVTPGYRSLLWDFGDADPAYEVLQVRHAFSKAGNFNVRFTATYPACGAVEANSNVKVIALPNINLGNDTTFCPGNAAMYLTNKNMAKADKYIWSTGDSTAGINITHEGSYWVKATNSSQCSAADSITISKGCYLDIPNAFTPGSGDEHDSYFLPRQLLSKSVITFEMRIFDRWGQLVFESDKTDGRGWDGKYKGQDMPFGVYVYLLKVSYTNGITESYNGNVTLLR